MEGVAPGCAAADLGAVFTFAGLRTAVDPVVRRVRVLAVGAQVAVPERRPALELHLRDARDVRHDAARRTLHPRSRFLQKQKRKSITKYSSR